MAFGLLLVIAAGPGCGGGSTGTADAATDAPRQDAADARDGVPPDGASDAAPDGGSDGADKPAETAGEGGPDGAGDTPIDPAAETPADPAADPTPDAPFDAAPDAPPAGDGPAPDFTFVATPAILSLGIGSSDTFTATVWFVGGFDSMLVDLWVTGVPVGVTATYDPDPLPHQGASAMMVDVGPSATPGTYTLTMGATSEGIMHSQDVTLVVTDKPDFTLALSPKTSGTGAGGTATIDVMVTPQNGFAAAVMLAASGLPAGASATFTPNPAAPPGGKLDVMTTAATAPGSYPFTVTGTSGLLTHMTDGTLVVSAAGSAWAISPVGTTGNGNNCVIVGPAHNDGVNRVYVGTVSTGRIYEFSWSGSAWSAGVDIGGSPGGNEMHNMTMGPGRNDGMTRIYAGSLDGYLYEFTWGASTFTQMTVGGMAGATTHAAVGDGCGDGTNRLYATRGANVREYTWNGSGWDMAPVGSVSAGIAHGIRLGDGRGDGVRRLYVASTSDGVYEASYAAGAWSMTHIALSTDTRNVNVGAGKNDGAMAVYAARADGTMSELRRAGSGWSIDPVGSPAGSSTLVHAYVVAGRNDGVLRVYSSAANGNVYEFSWSGSAWTPTTLGGGTGYMYGMSPGIGRNDDVMRLYAASFNNQVYEYTWK